MQTVITLCTMALILDGSLKYDAHMCSEVGNSCNGAVENSWTALLHQHIDRTG